MNVMRCLAATLMLLLLPTLAFSQTIEGALTGSKKVPDVRVIIDISGSMKLNDPNNLRRPALELLVKLFPEHAKAGVWTFGQWVNMLVKHGPIDDKWRDQAILAAQKINSVALYTNIPLALEKAAMNLDKLDPNDDTHMILLTDGMVDISKSTAENTAARSRIINTILPRLRKAGITIHTVALSKNADSELMERLAVETNGLTAVAETAEQLMEVFLQAFDAAAPAEQLPLEGNKFIVDSSIEEFTALIFKQKGSADAVLISPNSQRSSEADYDSDTNWYSDQNYELITVKSPHEGEWTIAADLVPGSRVTIVSNLSLVVSRLAASMFVGEDSELSVLLQERGKTIRDKNLLSLVDLQVSVTRRDDDQQWQFSLTDELPVPSNGLFAGDLGMLAEAGIYDISIIADGKSFKREQKQTVAVRETFDIKATSTQETPPSHTVTLFAQNPAIDTKGSSVLARVKRPDGSSALKAVDVIEQRTWQLSLQSVKQTGVYEVSFEATGQYHGGGRFDFTSESVQINHVLPGSDPIIQEPEPVIEPEPVVEEVAEPEVEAVVEPETKLEEPEEKATDGLTMADIVLYIGIAIGNILTIGLGYMAYKMVAGAGGSDILEGDDDIEIDDDIDVDETEETETPEAAVPIAEPKASPEPAQPPEPETATEPAAEVDTELDLGEPADMDEAEAPPSLEPESTPKPVEEEVEIDVDLETEVGFDIDDSDIEDVDDILDLPDDAVDIEPEK
ncbi:MAG: hypothetical protein ACJA0N_002065 [Pseudohongiellaceae bacterium]|jgi:uncharacterized protein (TIGR03503 family)